MLNVTLLAILLLAAPLLAQETKEFEIAGDQTWLDSGIELKPGDTARVIASGQVRFPGSAATGPSGIARGWRDLLRSLPVNDAGRGALVGRIGDRDASRIFLIGETRVVEAVTAGRLFLGLNRQQGDSATGSYKITVAVTRAAANTVDGSESLLPLPKVTQEMLDSIPTRVTDMDGTLGDRVNFLIVGSEDQVVKALLSAGWVKVDRTIKDTVMHGLMVSLSRGAYLTLPMSELYLFGRPQDYGFAHAEPVAVVARRHHFRIWRAPFEVDGQTLWAGAGTHDIGFEKDQRNGKITHKIDPEVDGEREYIGQSLNETGQVARLDYLTPANPIREAKTAHGAEFRSDGRTLIVTMKPEGRQYTSAFADLFAAVLKAENPDTGEWGEAAKFLQTAPKQPPTQLGPIPTKYRVLIVPGFMSACAASAPAFLEGQEHLREKHNIEIELFQVPNDSSENNARRIAEYVTSKMVFDDRQYIVVGYNKGAPDVQVSLAQEPGMKDAVAAFVSVAGAIGGSPVVDVLPGMIERWTSQLKLGQCEGDLAAAMRSLRRDVRRAFLASNPKPPVPSYSLVAISDPANTSKALQQAWKLMSVFDVKQDSQLTAADAMIPGSKFLGAALADHLAVALPFDKAGDQQILELIDQARYPRAALLETIVRFVTQDLEPASK